LKDAVLVVVEATVASSREERSDMCNVKARSRNCSLQLRRLHLYWILHSVAKWKLCLVWRM